MRRRVTWAAAAGLALTGGCSDLLVRPAAAPAGVAVSLAPRAVQALTDAGAREAFDAVDAARIVLVDAAASAGNPFATEAPLADATVPFAPGDTVRLSLELPDSAVQGDREIVVGVLLSHQGQALFAYAESVLLRPHETTRVPVPVLVPVPARVVLTADRERLEASADSARVQAVGLFATGDTVPDDLFFPEIVSLDPNVLAVSDEGTFARVRPVGSGTGRVMARAEGAGATAADTLEIVVQPPEQDTYAAYFGQLAVGGDFACGIHSDDATLFCWGGNQFGQLGTGGTAGSPVAVPALGHLEVRAVATGTEHACAIDPDGVLRCWGRNDTGQVGNGTLLGGAVLEPHVVTGGPWQTVSAGETHTCAIDGSGALFCWGDNAFGQLGTGSYASTGTPTRVGSELWQEVSAGVRATCGITADGAAKCWGSGTNGVPGNGGTEDALSPTPVLGGPWTRVRTGRVHACGVSVEGTVACWGRNVYGQLGIAAPPSNVIYASPITTVFQGPVLTLAPGSFHTCVVRQADGGYDCWGDDSEGQLGEGSPPAGTWAMVDASRHLNFTCGLRADLAAYCWGDGAAGQLGDGDMEDSAEPVAVRAACDCQLTDASRPARPPHGERR